MKETKATKTGVWKLVKKAAEVEADMKGLGWPPDCETFLYQAKRPKMEKPLNDSKKQF